MKEGWEVKKLGDVCEIKSGKSIQASYIKEDDGISPYKCYGGNGIRGYVDSYTHEGVYPIIGRVGALCGNIHLANGKFNATEHALIVDIKDEDVNVYWMVYNLKHLDLRKIAKGVAQPVISAGEVMKVYINVPTLKEQSRIVEELDQLSNIIEKKRQQLSELDNLAQSIFYDMFGDPVTNEKGWEVKKLGDICKTSSGGTPSKSHSEYYEGGSIPWLRSGEVNKMYILNTELFITEEGLENSSAKWFPENTVVIAMYGATVGQVGILRNMMTTNQAICGIFPNESFIPIYLYHFLLSKKEEYIKLASGGAQPNISQNIIKDTLVCCPPLSLQQLFAQKIEAIEKEKELIKQSIKETEELFNSRMDYYFG